MNKELIESLQSLKDQLERKRINAKTENYLDVAMAYSDAILLVGEEIVKHLTPKKNG